MTDFLFPPAARVSTSMPRFISNAVSSRSTFTGVARTTIRGGDRIGFGISTRNASNRENYALKAALGAYVARMRGMSNRFWFADPGYTGPRGSFPSTELLTNNTFANGTTGWTTTNGSLTVSDRVGRLIASTPASNVQIFQSVSLTQYVPYALRSFIADGAQTPGLSIGPSLTLGSVSAQAYSTNRGLITVSGVNDSAGGQNQFPVVFASNTGFTAGAYVECPFSSLSRPILIDNGPNLLTYSDQFDHANWIKAGTDTVSANSTASPDGTSTADSFVESGDTTDHYVRQDVTVSSSAADYAFSVCLKAGGRSWVRIILDEATGSSSVNAYFDITNGTVGTVAAATNWSNGRAFITNLGNGWFRCSIVGRKTNAATTIRPFIVSTTGNNGSTSIAGLSGLGFYAWRATLAQSSVPTRLVQTTSTATTGTAQTGSALYVKGLPASTSGLLLQDDRVQIGKQLNIVAASLDSDAAGLGYLECAIPWRVTLADNAPIIVNNPMMHAILSDSAHGYEVVPGQFADFDFAFEESCETS